MCIIANVNIVIVVEADDQWHQRVLILSDTIAQYEN